MPRKTGLNSVLAAMLCLTCNFASAADEGNTQPAAPKSDVEKHPEQPSDKQPTPKEETASTQSNQGDPAKPKEDPNCE